MSSSADRGSLRTRPSGDLDGKRDIFVHVAPRQQRRALKDEPEGIVASRRRRRGSTKTNDPSGRLHHVGNESQKCGLATPARPDDRAEPAWREVEIHLVERDHRLASAGKNH